MAKYKRASWNDYSGRRIYMITIVTKNRRPALGSLKVDDEGKAYIELSDLGHHVEDCWNAISKFHPEVLPLDLQIMPDHLHGLLFVTSTIECKLGGVVRGFKAVSAKPFKLANGGEGLWEENYHDRILSGNGQLNLMRAYIADNPRRLALRRANPQMFKVRREVAVAGKTIAAQGNIFLLQHPSLLQVQFSRSLTIEEIKRQEAIYVDKARKGDILVSPRISEAEKRVVDAALEAGGRLVMIVHEGMDEYTKPSGRYFDLMAQGRLLIVAPWPDAPAKVDLTRALCLAMNDFAASICSSNGRDGARPS